MSELTEACLASLRKKEIPQGETISLWRAVTGKYDPVDKKYEGVKILLKLGFLHPIEKINYVPLKSDSVSETRKKDLG